MDLVFTAFAAVVVAAKSTWIFRCPACKAHARIDIGAPVTLIHGNVFVRCCGATLKARRLTGIVTEHECNAKCLGSKGHVCECSCGGLNHGKAA